MPQMMPYNWLFIFMIMILILIILISFNYFFYLPMKKMKPQTLYKFNKFNWKW